MRPRLLEITAFGPFPATVRLDFGELGCDGLFLISGPTGAGKTSILDAMSYALYGAVPGERQTDRLRSDHADPRTETRVAFEFCLRGDDHRVTRVPQHERGKKTGTGTTRQQPKATLSRRGPDGAWTPVAEGVVEVGRLVTDMLGLTAQQFSQVVVLPQGQFADALRARPSDRRDLLSSLFATDRFDAYTRRLADRAREAEARVAVATTELVRLRRQARERWADVVRESSSPVPAPVLAAGTDTDSDAMAATAATAATAAMAATAATEAMDVMAAAAVRAGVAAQADVETAASAVRDAAKARRRAELVAERWRRRDEAVAVIAELDDSAAATEQARAAVAAATRAAPLAPLVAEAVRARAAAAAATEARRRAVQPLVRAAASLPAVFSKDVRGVDGWSAERPPPAAVVDGVRDAVRVTAVRLDQLTGAWDALGESRRVARAERVSAASAQATADELDAGAAQVEARLPALRERHQAGALALRRLDAAREETARLRRQAEAAGGLSALRSAADEANNAARDAAARAVCALTDQRELLRRRIDGMAAELAGQLRSGEACQVCGATEHPAPATSAHDRVSAEDVERAAADVTTIGQEADRLRERADGASQRLHAAEIAAGPAGADPVSAARRADAAAAALADDERAAADVDRVGGQLEAAGRALADARAAAAAARADGAAAAARAEGWTQAAARDEAVLRAQLGEVADPRSVAVAVATVVDRLDDVCAALERERQAAGEALAGADRLREMAAAQGFATVADVEAAVRDPLEVATLSDALAATDRRRTGAAAVLAEPALRRLPPRPDVAALETACRDAEAAAGAAHRRHGAIQRAAAELQGLVRRHREQVDAVAPLATDAQRLRHLADVFAGSGNDLRMSLESYVLAAYLEEITAAASQRLLAMTDGRYTVRHSDARAKHGGASGLSIVVHDAYTGTERDTGSLSGGETFQASLALALGVADVAQRHSGGVHLDTLFVDEGFGALDPEALDQALGELERLREGGRLVGVISHVAALRDRVTAGIEVVKTATGSDARVVTLVPV